jgi:ketosteroid isomerase-like protein
MPAQSDLDEFRNAFLPRQVAAEEAFHEGDVEPRLKLWSQRDPVTLFGAWGPNKSGWDDLSTTFRWASSRFSDLTDYRFEVVAAEVSGDLAYTVGYEHSTVSTDGAAPTTQTLRVTHIYRREDGEWRIVHRHGDFLQPDQSAS